MWFRRSFCGDMAFGKAGELFAYPLLESFFDTKLIHNPNPRAPFDFENDELAIEQKTRRCKKDTYPDTMLQYTKIDNCSLSNYVGKEKWFVFLYEDGLYGIKYDEEAFSKYKREFAKIADRTDKQEKKELRIFIDTKDLIAIPYLETAA